MPRVLVIDDDSGYVGAVVRAMQDRGFEVTGCDEPAEVLGWRAPSRFDYDLILLDLRLGVQPDGSALNAMRLLPHLKTYAPSSKVVVITVTSASVKESLRCIELGALAVFPKEMEFDELCGLAEVYESLGDPRQTREELIDVLWQGLEAEGGDANGQLLEMLAINLFDSIPTFRVIANNLDTPAGNIDVLVENRNEHEFWKGLSSLHIALECKNRVGSPEPQHFNQLRAVVKGRAHCEAGILVSTSPFTASFTRWRGEAHQVDGVHLFAVGPTELKRLVEKPYFEREKYLRGIFERQ